MNLSTGPVTRQAHNLCCKIEELPAGELQTLISTMSSELGNRVEELEKQKTEELSGEQLRKEIMSLILRYGAESDLSMYYSIGTLDICKVDVMKEINRRAHLC